MSIFNDKTIKNVADVVSQIMEQELSEGTVHPADAHRILKQTGGIDTLHHSLSDDQVSQRVKLAKEHGYVAKGDSPTGRSRAYRTTMHLQKQAAKHNPAFDVNEAAELSPKQKAIAKLAEPKHKIDAEDLAKLRAGHKPVKEEYEQINEVNEKQIKKDIDSGMSYDAVIGKHANKRTTNTDQIRKIIQQHAWNKRMKKEEIQSETRKTFSEMIELYKEKGLKSLHQITMNEEPTEEEFVKELERQKRKAAGIAPESEKAKVAAAATKGVKIMPEETELDEGFEDRLEAARAKAAEKGKIKEKQPATKSNVHKNEGSRYGGSKQKDEKEFDEERLNEQSKQQIVDKLTNLALKKVGVKRNPDHTSTVSKGDFIVHDRGHKVASLSKGSWEHHVPEKHKNMFEEFEIDERTLTEPEMEKREEVVKSMKKKMPEFKERYGKRAKEVLYATATKVAKGD